MGEDGFAQGCAVEDSAGDFYLGLCCGEDFGCAVGECDMGANGFKSSREITGEKGGEEADVGETSDVDVVGSAFFRGSAAGVGGVEAAMAFFDVGVPVLAGSEHEVEVALEVVVGVVAFASEQGVEEDFGELEIEGVLTGAEELMVVDAVLTPVGGLVMEDVAAFVEGGVVGAPEDAAGVVLPGGEVVANGAVVLMEGGAVVVPMHGHGESVCDEGAPG